MPPAKRKPMAGLAATAAMIADNAAQAAPKDSRFQHSFEVGLDQLEPDPNQARRRFDDEAIRELALSMGETGQLQPILVRKGEGRGPYVIVAGERRWRAAKMLGWEKMLAIEHRLDPEVAGLVENLQRVDLSPVEEAQGLRRLMEGKGLPQSEVAAMLGKPEKHVSESLRILSLPPDFLDRLSNSKVPLSRSALVELARVNDPKLLAKLMAQALDGRLTLHAIRAAAAGPKAAPKPDPVMKARPLNLAALDKVIARFAEAGVPRTQKDLHKARLEKLRADIDRLLAGLEG